MSWRDEHAARRAAFISTGCQGDFGDGWAAGVEYGKRARNVLGMATEIAELRAERDALQRKVAALQNIDDEREELRAEVLELQLALVEARRPTD